MELVDGGTASVLTEHDGPAGRAGADRRRAGLHPSARNRALRRQTVEHPCLAGLFPRGADRLRCRVTRSPRPSGGTRHTSRRRCRIRHPSCCAAGRRRPSPISTRWRARPSSCCSAHHRSQARPRMELSTLISTGRCRATRTKSPGCHALFDSVLDRALAKIPESRYDSCTEFVAQLTRALELRRLGDSTGWITLLVWGSHTPERSSSLTKSAMDSVSPRRDGSMLAASSRRADSLPLPAHSANALRDVLRRWAKAMSIRLNTCSPEAGVGRPRRGLVPVDADQSRVHPRDGPEHRRRHHAVPAHLAVEPDLGARHAVVLAAGLGGQPLGHLGLHHHHDGADRREVGEQVQQRRNGDVVRQVRDQRGRLLGQVARLQRRARRGSARKAG